MNQETLLEEYYSFNANKLHGMVDRILHKFGGIAQKDFDDFYSLANEVFAEVLKKYDESQSFEGFLYSCLANKIKNEITRRNRLKRQCDRTSVSLDMVIGEDGTSMGELLVADFNMEEELCERIASYQERRIARYIAGLSGLQKQILKRKICGDSKGKIVKELGLSGSVYDENFRQMKCYDKIRILCGSRYGRTAIREKEEKRMVTQTSEISKNTSYSIVSYIKKMENYSIRGDHPLQRNSNQWNNEQKYNLITTVLNRFPIPEVILAEQVRQSGTENWLIDGKQRLTNLSDYRAGVFKVGRNAERPVIKYQTVLRDSEGNVVLNDSGSPEYVVLECDVRGKYYEDLPEELKERFDDYTISAVQYLLCSDDDIEYHIRRYNAAKPMSAAQKGITHLGEQYAGVVKRIAFHTFFQDKGSFKLSEFTNGTMDRVVTESIMTIHFLQDWKKKQEDICAYLKEKATMQDFEDLEKLLDRLTCVIREEVADMFNSKDAFLWFGLFERFTRFGVEDTRFIEFMEAFRQTLHSRSVEGKSYDDLCAKGTKDKAIVIAKLAVMETLMKQFLHT